MKKLIWFTLIFGACAACARPPAQRPSNFSLMLEWDTGALPPQYHYAYIIRMDADGSAELIYSPAYAPLSQPDAWHAPFSLSPAQMDALYNRLREQNLLRSNWKVSQPLLGGSGTRISITAGEKTYVVPSVSVLSDSERKMVEQAIQTIRFFVPPKILKEMKDRQAQHEADFEY